MSDPNNGSQSLNHPPLHVSLVVAWGNHAGIAAEIKQGIYMIGRDRECQIRPKSHSVSDRHCLVQHQSDVVRVFDLDSEEGTFVNDEQLPPKAWKILNHGDLLRCGRYSFEVAIHLREDLVEVDQTSAMEGDAEATTNNTQALHQPHSTRDERDEDNATADPSFEDDFEFENLDDSMSHSLPALSASKQPSLQGQRTTKVAKSRIPLPKPKISYRGPSRFSGFSISFGGPDVWKVWIACIAMILTVGYVGWSIYQVGKGAPVKIIRGID